MVAIARTVLVIIWPAQQRTARSHDLGAFATGHVLPGGVGSGQVTVLIFTAWLTADWPIAAGQDLM